MDSHKNPHPSGVDPGASAEAPFAPAYAPLSLPVLSTKYPVLSTVTAIMLLVGWCTAALGAIGVLFGFGELLHASQASYSGDTLGMMSGSAKTAGGAVMLIGGLALVYLAESSRVIVDIENNTARLAERFGPPADAAPPGPLPH